MKPVERPELIGKKRRNERELRIARHISRALEVYGPVWCETWGRGPLFKRWLLRINKLMHFDINAVEPDTYGAERWIVSWWEGRENCIKMTFETMDEAMIVGAWIRLGRAGMLAPGWNVGDDLRAQYKTPERLAQLVIMWARAIEAQTGKERTIDP